MSKKILQQITKHKIIVPLVILTLGLGIYFIVRASGNQSSGAIEYTIGTVEKGTIISTISATGQANASSQSDLKTTASTTVLQVNAKEGDKVKAGDVLIILDSSDIDKQIRNARINLETAQNNYKKAIDGPTELQLAQAQNSLQNAKDNVEKLKISQQTTYNQTLESKENAETALENSYTSALNTIDAAFMGFSNIMNDLRTVLYLTNELLPQDITGDPTKDVNLIDLSQFYNVEIPKYWEDISNSYVFDTNADKDTFITLAKKATLAYKNARTIYDTNVVGYRNLSKSSSKEEIGSFLDNAINTAETITEATRNLNNLYNYFIDYSNQRKRTLYYNINTYNTLLKQDTSSANSYLSQLISAKTGGSGIVTAKKNLDDINTSLANLIKNQPIDLAAAQSNLKIQEASYKELISPPDPIEVKSYELSVSQAADNLQNLLDEKDENYIIKAPFDGKLANLNVNVGDKTSAGSILATVISDHSIAEISFTETDIPKIKVGQKATLTFDSVENLTITGKVVEVDTLGTTTQGVVSYTVKVSFDIEDQRIKPGMSVTADIITDSKSDILIVPNSAIRTSNGLSYVETFNNSISTDSNGILTTKLIPTKINVETGISDDTNTEIINGLNEGDKVVIKTSASNTSTSSSKSTSTSSGSNMNFMQQMNGGGGFPGR